MYSANRIRRRYARWGHGGGRSGLGPAGGGRPPRSNRGGEEEVGVDGLAGGERRFRRLVEDAVHGILMVRPDGRVIFANAAARRLYRAAQGTAPIPVDRAAAAIGAGERAADPGLPPLSALVATEAWPQVAARLTACLDGRVDAETLRVPGRRRDGGPAALEICVGLVAWDDRPALHVSLIDVSARAAVEVRLRMLSQAIEQLPAAVVIADHAGRVEYVNARFTEVSGLRLGEFAGPAPRLLTSPLIGDHQFADIWATITAGRPWRGDLLGETQTGDHIWERTSISPILDTDDRISHFVAVKEDVTLRKAYEQQLLFQANFDPLTGLPNWALAQDRLGQAISQARRHGHSSGLMVIDLDHFQRINESAGHGTGDRLLVEVGRRLRARLPDEATVARLGGDEFAVIVPRVGAARDFDPLAAAVGAAIEPAVTIDDREYFITASIGIAVFPDDGDAAPVLISRADAALMQAKRGGRGTVRFYTREIDRRARELVRVDRHLHHALERDELTLVYQPIRDAATLALVGVEALLRWHNAAVAEVCGVAGHVVPPDRFIPLAEDNGLIVPIGHWVLDTACRDLAAWSRIGLKPRLSVNVSSRQFAAAGLVVEVERTLARHGLAPTDLEFEITERLLMAETAETRAALDSFSQLGIGLAIDDFGTGFSSLKYLHRFPVTALKIDRSFVAGLRVAGADGAPANAAAGGSTGARRAPADGDTAALIEATITLGHGLGIAVVAEGVERPDQLAALRGRGCDLVQGFLFGRPVPAATVAASGGQITWSTQS